VIRPDGTIGRSFGVLKPEVLPDQTGAGSTRVLALSQPGLIWLASPAGHSVELWSTTGELQRTLIRQAGWFPGADRHAPAVSADPTVMLDAVWQAPDGLLWMLYNTHNSHWKATSRSFDEGAASGPGAMPIWDTVVEVVDPVRCLLLASHRFEGSDKLV
jgi:hypothetical protein